MWDCWYNAKNCTRVAMEHADRIASGNYGDKSFTETRDMRVFILFVVKKKSISALQKSELGQLSLQQNLTLRETPFQALPCQELKNE